ncbi:MAG: hypothetical protein IKR25_01790 [Muribaculaceae bacterium]|nr:hypothetical protein [Muribaculaceae bacterium]
MNIKKITDLLSLADKAKDLLSGDEISENNNNKEKSTKKGKGKAVRLNEDMTSEEEDQYISQTAKKLMNPSDVLGAIKAIANAARDAQKFSEIQETKREKIRAQRDADIAMIRAQRDAIVLYLERTFDERRAIFQKQFDIVDKAIERGDNQMLSLALQQINDLAASSPFKALTDSASLQRQLLTPGTEIDI